MESGVIGDGWGGVSVLPAINRTEHACLCTLFVLTCSHSCASSQVLTEATAQQEIPIYTLTAPPESGEGNTQNLASPSTCLGIKYTLTELVNEL